MRRLAIMILALAVILSLFGCQAAPSGPLYGMILTSDIPYHEKILEGFQTTAEELGAEVIVKYAATVEEQISAIETLQDKGVKGIAIQPAHSSDLRDALREASNDGIAIISIQSDTEKSQYYINPADTETVAVTLLDAIYDLTGGEGEFAIMASNRFSGSNAWVNALELLYQDEKYANLRWVDTAYCDPDDADKIKESTDALTSKYPDLKLICCPDSYILLSCCQTLDDAGSSVKATGLGNPSMMENYVGSDQVCPYFYLWNPTQIGECAAFVMDSVLSGTLGADDTSFTADNGTQYTIADWYPSQKQIIVGPPFQFDEDNIAQWAEIY